MKDPVNDPVDLMGMVRHWQDVVDMRYRQFLEQTTALEFVEARRHFDVFVGLLNARLNLQQTHLDMLDDGAPIQLLEADHAILRNLTEKARAALNDIETAKQPRSSLVEHLNQLVKLMNVLRHHDLRVVESLYTHIDNVLTEDANVQKTKQINVAMLNAMKPVVH